MVSLVIVLILVACGSPFCGDAALSQHDALDVSDAREGCLYFTPPLDEMAKCHLIHRDARCKGDSLVVAMLSIHYSDVVSPRCLMYPLLMSPMLAM